MMVTGSDTQRGLGHENCPAAVTFTDHRVIHLRASLFRHPYELRGTNISQNPRKGFSLNLLIKLEFSFCCIRKNNFNDKLTP